MCTRELRILSILWILLFSGFVVACSGGDAAPSALAEQAAAETSTSTPVPPTVTPTNTPKPPTATPTHTPKPPTTTPTHTPTDTPEPPTATPTQTPAPTATIAAEFSPRLVLWTAASKLSLLTLGYVEGAPETTVKRMWGNVEVMTDFLGVKLPPLFKLTGKKSEDRAAALYYLLNEAGPVLADYGKLKFGAPGSGMVSLAIKSNLAMLLYTPSTGEDNSMNDSLYKGIKSAAIQSELPDFLYNPVLEAMEQNMPYDEVKKRVFVMHEMVPAFLTLREQNASAPQPAVTPGLTAQAYAELGKRYFDQHDFDNAIANFTAAIELKSEPIYYHYRGEAYRVKKLYPQAITDLTQAITLEPQNAIAYYSRGLAYRDSGDYKATLSDFDQVLKLTPDYTQIYLERGHTYTMMGDYDHAVEDYTVFIDKAPDQAGIAYNNRGSIYRERGEYDKSIADFSAAIKLDPKYADAYYNRATAYHNAGKYDLALSDFGEAIRLNPQNADAYANRGNTYISLGKYDQAIADCNHAIKLNPKDAIAYYTRGLAYQKKGDTDQAIADYQMTIDLGTYPAASEQAQKNLIALGVVSD